MNPCEVTIHTQKKEKKRKKEEEENVKVKTCRRIHHYPNGHIGSIWIKLIVAEIEN